MEADLTKIYVQRLKPKGSDEDYAYEETYSSSSESLSMYQNFRNDNLKSLNDYSNLIIPLASGENINPVDTKTRYSDSWSNNDTYVRLLFQNSPINRTESTSGDDETSLHLTNSLKLNCNDEDPPEDETQFKRKKLPKSFLQRNPDGRVERCAGKKQGARISLRESPEEKRKRLDAEADRKRKYRLYSESPEQRRKRLDRDAERRRLKRLSMYAKESEEDRRERLSRESAKKRKARMSKYAKETEEERRERLRKDALRARELRFTRSVVETEEERRKRLIRDALRKRELRMQYGLSRKLVEGKSENADIDFREEEEEEEEESLEGYYLSSWTMWFQNGLLMPSVEEEASKISSDE